MSTKIEWCDSTVNPVDGCDGCELWDHRSGSGTCYAAQIHQRFTRPGGTYPKPFSQVVQRPGRMIKAAAWGSLLGRRRIEKPWLNNARRFIFVGDMSDIFSEGVSFEYIEEEIIDQICTYNGRRHFWIILTKRPSRVLKFQSWVQARGASLWGDNCWPNNLMVMTSITSNETISRAHSLSQCTADWLGLSIEPMLGRVDLSERDLAGISWVIAGGESGPHARPSHPLWFLDLCEVCEKVGVPFFFKQWGEWVPGCRIGDLHVLRSQGADMCSYQNGSRHRGFDLDWKDGVVFKRVGKKAAGRRLYHQFHNGIPGEVQTKLVLR